MAITTSVVLQSLIVALAWAGLVELSYAVSPIEYFYLLAMFWAFYFATFFAVSATLRHNRAGFLFFIFLFLILLVAHWVSVYNMSRFVSIMLHGSPTYLVLFVFSGAVTIYLSYLMIKGILIIFSSKREELFLSSFSPPNEVAGRNAWLDYLGGGPVIRYASSVLSVPLVVLSAFLLSIALMPIVGAPFILLVVHLDVISCGFAGNIDLMTDSYLLLCGADIVEQYFSAGIIVYPITFCIVVGIAFGIRLLGLRIAMNKYHKRVLKDPRSPIFYLRTFSDEFTRLPRTRQSLLENLLYFRLRLPTLEGAILENAIFVGPVVTLGVPGQLIRPAGAAREYHDEDAWRHRVNELVGKSKAIIVTLANTDSMEWEIEQIFSQRKEASTLFVVSPRQVDSPSSVGQLEMLLEAASRHNSIVLDCLSQLRASRIEGGLIGFYYDYAEDQIVALLSKQPMVDNYRQLLRAFFFRSRIEFL
jgi:hypothetical protein